MTYICERNSWSSGTGGIYPAGLPVGVVEEVVPDPLSRTYTATIIPAADFDNLTRVMIITSYSITKADETQHTEEESLP